MIANSLLLAAFLCIFTEVEALSIPPTTIVPEVHPVLLARVSQLVSSALGDDNVGDRYASARDAVHDYQSRGDDDGYDQGDASNSAVPPPNELVYGELSVPVLATILDAVGVQEDDVFLDIGSGDGALVLGASLLYANCGGGGSVGRSGNAMRKCFGVDIVPGLVERSITHSKNLERILEQSTNSNTEDGIVDNINVLRQNQAETQFFLGDIHQPNDELRSVLEETTMAVCFATTWSAGNAHIDDNDDDDDTNKRRISTSLQGRKLPKLSKALSTGLRSGCRVVVIDGKLDEDDGFSWEGDLRIQCPDTAPYSVATLYHTQ